MTYDKRSYVIYNSEHWLQRAVEFRHLADSVIGLGAQQTMRRIAEHYEHLASRTDKPSHRDGFPDKNFEKLSSPHVRAQAQDARS